MGFWAVIKDATVINTIVADSKEIAEEATGYECVEYTQEKPAGIGFSWDGKKFVAPVIIDAVVIDAPE